MSGTLALVGGGEWTEGCGFDADLLAESGGTDVVVLPTAAAYEHPERAVEAAARWFEGLGGRARGVPVLRRSDADDPTNVSVVRGARFLYLGGGSPLHLRSVLKGTPVWKAILDAWADGAVVAGSSAGAMVLCDPMVDPRGGAFTVGLGLVANLALIPHAEAGVHDVVAAHRRTLDLADEGLVLAAVPERTAVIREPGGTWRAAGADPDHVAVFVDGRPTGLDALPG